MHHRRALHQLLTLLLGAVGASVASCGGGDEGDCEVSDELEQDGGKPSGIASCEDGTRVRTGPVECAVLSNAPTCAGTETILDCQSDSDCTDGPHGVCISYTQYNDFEGTSEEACGCRYPCQSDADCASGTACLCSSALSPGFSTCISATCRSGADCDSGECSLAEWDDGCGTIQMFACRTESDTCRTNSDCASGESCAPTSEGGWLCQPIGCAIGRPLLVAGAARTAPTRARSDWSGGEVRPCLDGLSAAARASLARYWHDVARMEHASVASFARFTLELMAAGAPPELLLETQRAAADEVEHARLTYSLASAYGDEAVGPGALDVSGVGVTTDRHELVAHLVEEACVGELAGVSEALYAAASATDPVVRAVLERIAHDETRHAELAWRALRWLLLDEGDDELWEVTREAFSRAGEALRARVEDAEAEALPAWASAHGQLSRWDRRRARLEALRDVIEPCAAALFVSSARRASAGPAQLSRSARPRP